MLNYIDVIIICSFIVASLAVGILSAKRIKNINDFISSYKAFHPSILGLSLIMVIFGGGTIAGTMVEVRNVGLIYAIASFGYVLNSLITARYIIPKIDHRFYNMLTVCDAMNMLYGKNAKLFTAYIAIIFDLGAATSQLSVLGKTMAYFLNSHYNAGLLLTGGVMVFYSAIGGIKTVTVMDIVKCTLLFIFMPIVASMMIYMAGGFSHIIQNIPSQHLAVLEHPEFFKYTVLFVFFMAPVHMLQPIVVQRIFMINDNIASSNAMYMYGLVRTGLIWMVTSIALASFILLPDAPSNTILLAVINLLPPILLGFAIITIMATVMCKADAHLNSMSLIVLTNLPFPKFISRLGELNAARCITSLTGSIALFIAMLDISIINIIIFIESLWSISIGVPLIAGIMRIQLSRQQFHLYLAIILPLFVLMLNFGIAYYTPLILLIISISCILAVKKVSRKLTLLHVHSKVISYISSCSLLYKRAIFSASERMKEEGGDYFVFSIFFCINYTVPYFMWDYSNPDTLYVSILLRIIAGLLCLGLLLKNFWPKQIIAYFPLYWYATLTFTLPFMTFLMLFLQDWHVAWLINVVLSIFFLVLLTDWIIFICITFTGLTFSIIIHLATIGYVTCPLDNTNLALCIYAFSFLILIGAIFSRRKQEASANRLEVANLLGSTIAHEMRTFLLSIQNYASGLSKHMPVLIQSYQLAHDHNLLTSPLPVQQFIPLTHITQNIQKVVKKASSFINLLLVNIKKPTTYEQPKKINLWACIEEAINDYPLSENELKYINIIKNAEYYIMGYKEILIHILFNLLSNSLYYLKQTHDPQITIWVSQSNRSLNLHFKDNGCGIKKDNLDLIFKRFYTNRQKGFGLGLSFCKVSMNMLGGDISCTSVEGEYTEFTLQFPLV